MTSTVRSIVSDGLGMIQYPVGTCESSDMGDHIMGVVALAWCTDDAIDRWGEPWARQGSIDMRFRSHLTAGLDLTIATEQRRQSSEVTVTGADGTMYATGTLRPGPTMPFEPSGRPAGTPFPVPPQAELLDGYELHPIEFDHVAERDLRLTDHLVQAGFWRRIGWAHRMAGERRECDRAQQRRLRGRRLLDARGRQARPAPAGPRRRTPRGDRPGQRAVPANRPPVHGVRRGDRHRGITRRIDSLHVGVRRGGGLSDRQPGSRGSPSTRSPTMLRWISDEPA